MNIMEEPDVIDIDPSRYLKKKVEISPDIIDIDLEKYQNKELPQAKQPQKFPFEEENDLEREIERNTARGTSRVIETALGTPGNIESFFRYMFGNKSPSIFPTSSDIKKKTQEFGQGYLTPETEVEKISDELLEDITSLSLPGSGTHSILRNVGIASLGQGSKQLAKSMGSTESTQDLVKTGLMTMVDLMNLRGSVGKGGTKKYATELFNESEKLIPEGAKIRSSHLVNTLDNLQEKFSRGGKTPSTASALEKISEIKNRAKTGEIPVNELIAFRKSINELVQAGGGFAYQEKSPIRKKAIMNLQEVKSAVIDGLKEYGKHNKEFGKLNTAANEAFSAYSSSNAITNFIKNKIGNKITDNGLKAILGIPTSGALAGIAAYSPHIAGGATAAAPIYSIGKIIYRMNKSPTLAKYYGDILRYSLQENVPLVSKNIKAFEKEMKKEDIKQEKFK